MNTSLHHIRLVAGIEIRPPGDSARFVLEHDHAARLSEPVADDLAACVSQATEAHLCMVGSLFEPGQILSLAQSPWDAMIEVGRLNQAFQPGVTAIGSHQDKPARDDLAPINAVPSGLFLCLPLVLSIDSSQATELETVLEQSLFDQGGLKPPSLGTLYELTGLEPVHGQLMTLTDLMALTKMQLAAAGLDAFWAPVEHALLQPKQSFDNELPASLNAQWSSDQQCFEIEFITFDESDLSAEDYGLWLRAFRQTTALLDAHWIDWQCFSKNPNGEIEAGGRWLIETSSVKQQNDTHVWTQQLEGLSLVAYSGVHDGVLRHYYPLTGRAIRALEQQFTEQGQRIMRDAQWHEHNGRLLLPNDGITP